MIYRRRSVRNYSTQRVEDFKIEQLLKAGMQAPSALNQQGWEFIVVKNKEMLTTLSTITPYSKPAQNADFCIIALANFNFMPRYSDSWEQDLSACVQNIMLEAVNQGLATVWLGVAPDKNRMNDLRLLFNLDAHIKPFAIIAGGYPQSDTANHFVDRFDRAKIHYEKY